jgi:hypothetical protein
MHMAAMFLRKMNIYIYILLDQITYDMLSDLAKMTDYILPVLPRTVK